MDLFSISEILDLAIQIEKNGQHFYEEALSKGVRPPLRSLMELLIEEEKKHIVFFSQMKEVDDPGGGKVSLNPSESDILRDIIGGQSFSLEDVDISNLEVLEELLKTAIEFEEDTILFYQMISSFMVHEGNLAKVNEIIHEESRHVTLLQETCKSIS